MSLEAIKIISEAEDKAKRANLDAAAAAKRMIADAESSGRQAVEDGRKKAAVELMELRRTAAEKAREETMNLARTTENRKAAMLVKANSRAEKAIELVTERIVNS